MKETVISIENLKKSFNDFVAVNGLSFEIQKSEIFGFLGPNGAGKTTTINMICGLLKPDSGNIRFKGCNSFSEIKQKIGYCPQENIFYPKLTCIEQLVFIGSLYGMNEKVSSAKATELLKLLGLADKEVSLAGKLSGGMKRRLSICLALIHDPEILVLDEPEAGLDPQSRILVREFIRTYANEKTVILTTHNMDEADRLADRIAIIDNGKILLLDKPENLKQTVGEGDLLEIVIQNEIDEKKVLENLSEISEKINIVEKTLIIKSKNIIEKMPLLFSELKNCNVEISEAKIRENSLEDVFISLTGRKLRQ